MKLQIRPTSITDCRDIYDWRTNEINSEFSFTGKDFKYEDHEAWFARYLEDEENLMLVVEYNDKPCCVMRFDGAFEEKTVSIYMVPGFHGKKLSLPCLLLGELYLRKPLQGLKCNLHAEIMMNNEASIALFSQAGYRYSMADWWKVI